MTTTTLRQQALQLAIDQAENAERKSHQRNYEKLHIHRDGTVSWFECLNESDDIIDRGAKSFRAVPSVITVGTGSCACNCDFCSEIGQPSSFGGSITEEMAIDAAISEGGWQTRAEIIEEEFERVVPMGYFDDEDEEAAQ